jgi:hypothetical protein
MPKQTYKVLDFSGGQNSSSDPRDIKDNEFQELQGFAVDKFGKLEELGHATHRWKNNDQHEFGVFATAGLADSIGHGAFAIVTDDTGFSLCTESDDANSVIKAYAIIQRNSSTNFNFIALDEWFTANGIGYYWSQGADAWESSYGATWANGKVPIFYYIDKGLRIMEAYHAGNSGTMANTIMRKFLSPKLYGGINKAEGTGVNKSWIYNSDTGANVAGNWKDITNAEITGAFPEIDTTPSGSHAGTIKVGQNLIMANSVDARYVYDARGFAFAGETVDTGNDANDLTSGSASNCHWGIGIKHAEYANDTGNWMPTKDTRYRFYCSTVYDGEQESIPQLFSMYESRSLFEGKGHYEGQSVVYDMSLSNGNAWHQTSGATFGSGSTTITHDGTFRGNVGMYVKEASGDFPAGTKIASITSDTVFEIDKNTTNSESTGSIIYFGLSDDKRHGERIALSLSPVGKMNGADHADTASAPRVASGIGYNFGASTIGDQNDGNRRISGVRIYYSTNEDGHNDLWQLFDWDFEKGIKARGAEGGSGSADVSGWTQPDSTRQTAGGDYWYTHFHGGANVGDLAGDIGEGFKFLDPPKVITYKDINGHGHDELITVDSAKACTLVNNRVYLGNVQQDGVIYGDRMIKSPMKQYDKFPESHFIDVATDDGDEIIALENFADRILQFKKNAMHVINVQEDNEILEFTNKYRGVPHPGCIVKTEYGVAWINDIGLFMYDGQKVINLLEKDGIALIDTREWKSTVGHSDGYKQIGYIADKKNLVIRYGEDGSTAGWIFNLLTRSIVKHPRVHDSADAADRFNWINNPITGALLIPSTEDNLGGALNIWQHPPVQDHDGNVDDHSFEKIIWTKDIDFGEPHVRKKLYKVYISYKGDCSGLTVKYYTNGENDSSNEGFQFNSDDTPLADHDDAEGMESWNVTELKPTNSSEANNIYSCSVRISGTTVAKQIEINDITFVYRVKNVK